MIKNLLQEGFALKSKGHYKHAIEVFYKALELDNSSAELLLEIAELYYLMGSEERALSNIEQILDANPTHIESLKLLEKIFKDKNALEEAEQTAKNIYCISHEEEDLVDILKLLNQQGKYDEVMEFKVETPNCRVILEQARACFYNKKLDLAKSMLESILQIEPKNQEAMLLYGKVLYANNEKDKCVPLVEYLLLDDTNADLLNFVALVKSYDGELKTAERYLQLAIKADRKNAEYYFNLGTVYFKSGDIGMARKYFNLAISISPENRNYHFALANLYYSEKHYKKALEELRGDFFEARLLKAVILYDTGYVALAKKEFAELRGKHPDNPIVEDYWTRIEEDLKIN